MRLKSFTAPRRHLLRCAAAAGACALMLASAAPAGAQGAPSLAQTTTTPTTSGAVTATLEQCVTSLVQAERSATFTGEMTAVPGAARMAMRIDVEERAPGELEFHTITAAGLGVWRWADPKVKVYKYLKQVTNLSSPASYRGFVRFRWINAKGHVIKRAERLTARCVQPASPPPPQSRKPVPPSLRRRRAPRRAREPGRRVTGRRRAARMGRTMKAEIHPSYTRARVHCTCGNEFITRATQDELRVEVCSNCHPFYTGRQKLVDSGGRVERFQRRVAKGRMHSAQTRSA